MAAERRRSEAGEQLYGDLRHRWRDAKPMQKPNPSEYEKLMCDKERGLLDLKVNPSLCFEARPPTVVFEGNRDNITLVLFNRSTATHSVSLQPFYSSWLQMAGKKKLGQRIAQGMEAVVNLHCTAMGQKASTMLTFTTDEGDLTVPVNVIGPRSRLEAPDELTIGESLVKKSAEKKLVLQNKGDVALLFALHIDSPFTVSPNHVTLAAGGRADAVVTFNPTKRGKQFAELVLMMESGDLVGITIGGVGLEARGQLDTETLIMPDTLIGTTSVCTVMFRNWSDATLSYRWSNNCMPEMDDALLNESVKELSETFQERLSTMASSMPLSYDSQELADRHTLQRELDDQKQLALDKAPMFTSDVFQISPLSGVIFGQRLHEFTVQFSPTSIEAQVETAYLEVEGFQDRIGLTLTGKSVGAELVPSCRAMDLGHVMANEVNNFEIQIENISDLDAEFSVEVEGPARDDMLIVPSSGVIKTLDVGLLQISLSASQIGEFCETIVVDVHNSNCKLEIKLRAVVVAPLLHFAPATADFGTVSFGFAEEKRIVLCNACPSDVHFTLAMKGLGQTTNDFQVEEKTDCFLAGGDKSEFTVTYCASECGFHKAIVELTVVGISEALICLPLHGTCDTSELKVANPLVSAGLSFLQVEYQHLVDLVNDSPLPLLYSVQPQEDTGSLDVKCTCLSPKGVITPHSSAGVPFSIMALKLGTRRFVAKINISGREEPAEVTFQCIGQGPVLSASPTPPTALQWGKIEVLKDVNKMITFRNESPIESELVFEMETKAFRVDVKRVVLEPGGQTTVAVVARLTDVRKFTDVLSVNVTNGKSLQYPLIAIGHGTTLRFQNPLPWLTEKAAQRVTMKPVAKFKSGLKALSLDIKAEQVAGLQVHVLDLGSEYSHMEYLMELTVVNEGDKRHDCSISTWGYAPSRVHHLKMAQSTDGGVTSKTALPSLPETLVPAFRVEPENFILYPQECVVLSLCGFSDVVRYVQERIIVQAICGKSLTKEKMMSVDVCCDFVEPLLRISSQSLKFEIITVPEKPVSEVCKPLRLSNVIQLPIDIVATTRYPFAFRDQDWEQCKEEQSFRILPQTELSLLVYFDPAYEKHRLSRSIEGQLTIVYQDSMDRDTIPLSATVQFPNIEIATKMIDFGDAAWHAKKSARTQLTNTSLMPATYHWELFVLKEDGTDDDEGVGMGAESSEEEEEEEVQAPAPRLLQGDMKSGTASKLSQSSGSSGEFGHDQSSDVELQPQLVVPTLVMEAASQSNTCEEPNLAEVDDPEEVAQRSTAETPVSTLYVSQPALVGAASLSRIETEQPPKKAFPHVPNLDPSHIKLFDVLPRFGTLAPGESQTVGFTFTAECGTRRECLAICKVSGGPHNKVRLFGRAAKTKYDLDSTELDCGLIRCGEAHLQGLTIFNKGVGALRFSMIPPTMSTGSLAVVDFIPREGEVPPNQAFTVQIQIVPGLPVAEEVEIGVRVAQHCRQDVKLRWLGRFATMTLNTPRVLCVSYLEKVRQAQLSFRKQGLDVSSEFLMDVMGQLQVEEQRQPVDEQAKILADSVISLTSLASKTSLTSLASTPNLAGNAEIMNVQVQIDAEIDRLIMQSYLEQKLSNGNVERPLLPERLLNIGPVKVNEVSCASFAALNGMVWPLAFNVDQDNLKGTGFFVTAGCARKLTALSSGSVELRYDPYRRLGWHGKGPRPHQSQLEADLTARCGHVSGRVIFDVPGHALIVLRVEADLFMPSLVPATEEIAFADTKVGECNIFSLRISNPSRLPLQWRLEVTKPKKPKVDKFMPMHLKKKFLEENKPKPVFEVHPVCGSVGPELDTMAAVMFMPQEEKTYSQQLKLYVNGMARHVDIELRGSGLEPQLVFPVGTRKIGPTLPYDTASTDVVVSNPCDYPVEFIATQFDQQQRLESQILAWDNAYDKAGTLISPLREPGQALAEELLIAYRETLKRLEEDKTLAAAATAAAQAAEEAGVDGSAMDVSSTVALAESSSSIGRSKSRSSAKPSSSREKEKKKDKKETKKERELREAAEAEAAAAARAAELEAARLAAMTPLERIRMSVATLGAGAVPPLRKPGMLPADHFSGVLLREKLGLEESTTVLEKALCTYVNIDTSQAGRTHRRSQGIGVIVHGAPGVGKSIQCEKLAKLYSASVLRVDSVLQSAMDEHDSHGGARASEYIINAKNTVLLAAQRELEAAQQAAAVAAKKNKQGMSRNRSSVTGLGVIPGQAQTPLKAAESGPGTSPASASLAAPTPGVVGGDEVFDPELLERAMMNRDDIKVALDEDIAVEIIQHRLQNDDCHLGVIFDGLETSILADMAATYRILQRAIGGRQHSYFFDLFCDSEGFKEREMQRPYYEYTLEDHPMSVSPVVIPDWRTIEEDDYDALSEEMKRAVDDQQVQHRRQEKQRRLEEEAEKCRLQELQEAEERRLEEEKLQKKKKKAGRLTAESPATSSANLSKHKGSRPSSAARSGAQQQSGLANQASQQSLIDPESGRSRLLGTGTRSRVGSTVGLDRIRDGLAASATNITGSQTGVESVTDDSQSPEFKDYLNSRTLIQESMSRWDKELLVFLPAEDEAKVSGSNITVQSVRKPLSRVKEAESKAEINGSKMSARRATFVQVLTTHPPSARNMSPRKSVRVLESSGSEVIQESPVRQGALPGRSAGTAKSSSRSSSASAASGGSGKGKRGLSGQHARSGRQRSAESRSGKEPRSGRQRSAESRSGRQRSAESRSGKEPRSGWQRSAESRSSKEPRALSALGNEMSIDSTASSPSLTPASPADVQFDSSYHTVKLDDGQHVDDVMRHLLTCLPTAEEVSASIPSGPQHLVPLPPTVFQLIKRSTFELGAAASDSKEMSCFSIMTEPAPVPLPEPTIEMIMEAAAAAAASEASSKPASADKGKRPSPLDSGKRLGSTKSLRAVPEESGSRKKISKQSSSRSPRMSRQSGRASASIDDPLSGRPSSESLDSLSMTPAETKPQPTSVHRWVVQPHSSVTFHVHFNTQTDVTVDQVLTFQIVGSGRKYELFCRGTAESPSCDKDLRLMWPKVLPSYPSNEQVKKAFITDKNTFDFGPLMVGQSHERIREGIFPEHMAKVKLRNNSGLPVRVDPSFEKDAASETFLVEPKDTVIQPRGTAELTLFATPRTANDDRPIVDNLRISFNQNPRPLVFKVACRGSDPGLEITPNDFYFGKIVVGRTHFRVIKLRNSTRLPVGFHVSGLNTFGDGFKLDNDHGIVEPGDTTNVKLSIKSTVPLQLKKALRLEVYDAKQVVGLLHSENIPVTGEVYDVQVDISYPKNMGIETGDLEFGSCRVYDEQKLIMNVRNKGKYAAEFHFHVDKESMVDPDVMNSFSMVPHKGILNAGDKPTSVVVTFCPDREVDLNHVPIFRCEIKDPNYHDSLQESLAFVPVNVSAKTVYSKYAVQPVSHLNFGTLTLHTRRERKFTLMNEGEFDFRFTMFRHDGSTSLMTRAMQLKKKQAQESFQEKNKRMKEATRQAAQAKKDALQKPEGIVGQGASSRLTIGVFTVCPAMGAIPPGGQVLVSVECHGDVASSTEILGIDVSDRSPTDNPTGFRYKLLMDACTPGVDVNNFTEMFEEHRIVNRLANVSQAELNQVFCGRGTFCTEDRRFLYHNVMVGTQAKALFKIMNKTKLTCDVNMTIKGQNAKASTKLSEIFDIQPSKFALESRDMKFVTVTFTPQVIQPYSCSLDIGVADSSVLASSVSSRNTKTQCQFEICGEGVLPRFSLVNPLSEMKVSPKSKHSSEVLPARVDFARLIPGRCSVKAVTMKNDSLFPCKFEVRLIETPDTGDLPCFSFAMDTDICTNVPDSRTDRQPMVKTDSRRVKVATRMTARNSTPFTSMRWEHALTGTDSGEVKLPSSRDILSVDVDRQEEFQVKIKCAPNLAGKYQGELQVLAIGNQFESLRVDLHAEGYVDDVSVPDLNEVMGYSLESISSISLAAAAASESSAEEGGDVSSTSSSQRTKRPRTKAKRKMDEGRCSLLDFGGVEVNAKKVVRFHLTNHSDYSALKFKFIPPQSAVAFSLSPLFGHISAGRSKTIHVAAGSDTPICLERLGFICETQRIHYYDEQEDELTGFSVDDWDERCVVAKLADMQTESELKTKKKGGNENAASQVQQLEEEPRHVVLEGMARDLPFALSFVCEHSKYECPAATIVGDEVPIIKFRDTAFFQARDTCVPLHNTGKVGLRYQWSVVSEDGVEGLAGSQLLLPEDMYGALLLPESRREELPSFFISPTEGVVQPGDTVNFKATFRPILAGRSNATFMCRIANSNPEKSNQVGMCLEGVGVVPLAHFDLEPSDYLTGGRRATEILMEPDQSLPPGAKLDMNTNVVEFTSHGLQPLKREFRVSNPTSTPWKYEWQRNGITIREAAEAFHIDVMSGILAAGQRATMSIEFAPAGGKLLESFWTFCIPEHQLCVPFLLVGRVRDPAVSLTANVINFGSTLKGRRVKRHVDIVNDEDASIDFHICDPGKKVDLHTAKISISPRMGKVPPKSSRTVNVELVLHVERELSFNVACKIKGMVKHLPLNIKADGYDVHVDTTLEIPSASGKPVPQPIGSVDGIANVVDYGKVQINEKCVRVVSVYNSGRFPVAYVWQLSPNCATLGGEVQADLHSGRGHKKLITLKPQAKGLIEPSTSLRFTLAYCPSQSGPLVNCEALCQIVNGPAFNLLFAGEGCKPALHLSFTKHDFGPCFLGAAVMQNQRRTLVITCNSSKPSSVKCLHKDNDHLTVEFSPCVLQPGRSQEAVISFHPKAVEAFSTDVLFEANGLSSVRVRIAGEGASLKVDVADRRQKMVHLKSVRPCRTCSQTVKLVNHSPAQVTFDVGLSPRATLELGVITIKPHSDISLGPGASVNVIVTFSPVNRMPRFTEEIFMDCAGISMSLFTVSAACIARDISLDNPHLAFGDIMLGSSAQRRLVMFNTGDLPSKFQWEAEKFGPDFSISPVTGVTEPGMVTPFIVKCKPERIFKDIHIDGLKCHLENGPPLVLTLTASCGPKIATREPIQFNCHVRTKETKSIAIKNPTSQTWSLRPVIEGPYWSGTDSIVLEPGTTKQYEVVYKPVVMTTDGKKHQGTIFIALPDGGGLYYAFVGMATEPKQAGNIVREWSCKKQHIEVLTITNWLKIPQRFQVRIDHMKPDKIDPATCIRGMEYLDVPASGKANYELIFYAHREGTTVTKITIHNPETKEYLFYVLSVKATAADVVFTADLSTPVRQTMPYSIPVHNPLSTDVVFSTTVTSPDVSLPPQFTIPPHSDGECMLEYLPLKVGRSAAKLTFTCQELGTYVYELVLQAVLAPPEQALCFQAALGDKHVQTCHFTNYARNKTEYICKSDNMNFLVERAVSALAAGPGGTALSTDVTFEPHWLGESKGTVTIASSVGGEYQFPISAVCVPPKPQGPFQIKSGVTTTIPFKNIFAKTAQFQFSVNNPQFTLRSTGDSIRPRKVHYVVVGFDGASSASRHGPVPTSGTLTVTCTPESLAAANLPSQQPMTWLFYLRGVMP